MRQVSIHTGAWRYPGAIPDANFNFPAIKRFIQTLERAKFDAFFMADHLAVLNANQRTQAQPYGDVVRAVYVAVGPGVGDRAHRPDGHGLATYDAHYHIARRFASLDHISNGRAGWNIVTTSNPDAALNFGLEEDMEHDARLGLHGPETPRHGRAAIHLSRRSFSPTERVNSQSYCFHWIFQTRVDLEKSNSSALLVIAGADRALASGSNSRSST